MADTSIGKAYVQIIPKADGISGQIENLISPAAEASGSKGGLSLGKSLLSGLAKAGIVAGVTKLISDSISAGADLQQSFGGLDTLYGDAADTAKEYAYQAAAMGISANDYAEQAVSFGAALKSAFGGDVVKAADSADMAISDMADNAAKMGTPIESLQNAYQGFAKGNYTMLDNLKLGFGGTKEEMQRLLETAENSPHNVLGKSFDIDNLGDVYEAIHIIQEDLDLTGVAADEASTTFSGSLGAMKAAAQNVMADLALGNDIRPSLNALATSVKTFLVNNLLPMLANMAKQIPTILAMLPQFIADMAPDIIAGAADIVVNLVNGIVDNIPTFIAGLGNLISALRTAFTNIDWASVANSLLTGLSTAVGSIWDSVTELLRTEFGIDLPNWETVVQNISDLWDQVKAGIGEFFKAAFDIIMDDDMTIIEKISALWDLVKAGIGDFFKTIFEIALPAAQEIITAIDTWWSTNIWPSIQDFFKTTFGVDIPSWEDVKEAVSNFWNDFKAGIADFFKTTFNVELPSWEDVKAGIKAGWDTVKKGIGNIFSWVFSLDFPNVDDIVQSLKDWWGKVVKGVGDFFTLKWIFGDEESDAEAAKHISSVVNGATGGGGSFNLSGDTVNIDSKSIQDALNSANLTLSDIDTSSIDVAKQAVADGVAAMEAAVSGAKLELPTVESSALQAVSQVIALWVAAFKRQLKFSWLLPTPHGWLPQFSVTMREAGDGTTKTSYPVFSKSLQWFAKGGIFDAPSVIGVGEAGAEAVVPLDRMWAQMDRKLDEHSGPQINQYFTVNGAQDPDMWATSAARTLKRELRMT
jgi:hypothetical protein